MDVSSTAWQIPSAIGFVERERLVLLSRGLNHVPAAASLLEDWSKVLRSAYRRWLADPDARLTRGDVQQILEADPGRTRLVGELLLREGWAIGSGEGGRDDDWSRELHSGVRTARGTRNATELIRARDAVEFPPTSDTQQDAVNEGPEAGRNSRLSRVWRLVSENQLIAAVVAGIVLAAGGAVIALVTDDGSTGNNPTTKPPEPQVSPPVATRGGRREQAGSKGARTFANPHRLSGQGVGVKPYQHVVVRCKLYAPDPPSVKPDGYWYRLASRPWSDSYYAPANSFWNGDIPGREPYTHNTDFAVPDC